MNPEHSRQENNVVPFPKREASAPTSAPMSPQQSGPGEVIAFPRRTTVSAHESVSKSPSLHSLILDHYTKERKQETVQEQERLIRLVSETCTFVEGQLALARESSMSLSAEIADMYAERLESVRALVEKATQETARGLSDEELDRLYGSSKELREIMSALSVYIDSHSA